MTEESDPLLVSLLAGFGRTHYTRPSTELLGELRRAVS